MRAASLAAVSAALAVAACASPPAEGTAAATSGPRQCFNADRVNGFTDPTRESVRVTVGVKEVYELTFFGACPDVDWATQIGVRTRGGGSFVCDGLDVELVVPQVGTDRARTCLVRSIRKLTPEEAEAPAAER